jgi:hypothetical protein
LGLFLISVLVAWPGAAAAQPTVRIGFLWGGGLSQALLRDFESGLRERGWEVGRNVAIEHRVHHAAALAAAARGPRDPVGNSQRQEPDRWPTSRSG